MKAMSRYAADLVMFFREHENRELAGPMEAYMRNHFPFLGIKTPERKQLLREYIQMKGKPQQEDLEELVTTLWSQPEREFQYIALTFMDKLIKQASPNFLQVIEELIGTKSWWDTIDHLASNTVGVMYTLYPEETERYIQKWIVSENIWYNRIAILYQLKYKENTDETKLYEFINQHKDSSEFFIQKAIGWALREYSKTNPESVKDFIEQTDLAPLSRREGLKIIQK
ncbi:DNA alkylation repair protein [Bacillus coahuilensis p1.1.43]|uniref:DNA alkylation repair protein n=2 Tax=Bacillus coahuilensis TaxID=408580 RepID=A0A147K3Y8_9BACI|nr:DNA alkylation repair protein [Bacillus coahuilensis]KUP03994.1 DNA alkylation repair protein [Bacillus coahuilensis p1.1.43]